MIIALRHEEHGVHICYGEDEARLAEKYGWVRDKVLGKELAGQAPVDKSLRDSYIQKFGKPPHHKMSDQTILKALA